jgi:hypothetical protein
LILVAHHVGRPTFQGIYHVWHEPMPAPHTHTSLFLSAADAIEDAGNELLRSSDFARQNACNKMKNSLLYVSVNVNLNIVSKAHSYETCYHDT